MRQNETKKRDNMRIGKKQITAIALLVSSGLTKREIAESVSVSRGTLYRWLEDEDFKTEYDKALAEETRSIKSRILGLTKDALKRQEYILTSSRNDNAAAAVASDVLNRAGFKPEDNINVSAAEAVMIVDDLDEYTA